MVRRTVTILSVLLMLVLIISTLGAAATSSDIIGHWAEGAILEMKDLGVVNGYPDDTFRPDAPVTRAEVTAMLARLYQVVLQRIDETQVVVVEEERPAAGPAGPRGPQGPQGPAGPPGPPGADGVSGYEVIAVEKRFEPGFHTLEATCDDGKVAIGGGFEASGPKWEETRVYASQPTDLDEVEDGVWRAGGWSVTFDNSAAPERGNNMKVIVICALAN